MSRIGKMPVAIPKGVEVKADAGRSSASRGPKGELVSAHPGRAVGGGGRRTRSGSPGRTTRSSTRAFHGLLRSLVANSVEGVTKGFSKELEIVGVGYRAEVKGKSVVFSLGFSHPIDFPIPEESRWRSTPRRDA